MVPNKPLALKMAIYSPKPLEFLQMVERGGLCHLQMTHIFFLNLANTMHCKNYFTWHLRTWLCASASVIY